MGLEAWIQLHGDPLALRHWGDRPEGVREPIQQGAGAEQLLQLVEHRARPAPQPHQRLQHLQLVGRQIQGPKGEGIKAGESLAGSGALLGRHLIQQGGEHTVVPQQQAGLMTGSQPQLAQAGQQQPQQFGVIGSGGFPQATQQLHTALQLFGDAVTT